MAKFMFLLRENPADSANISPQEIQAIIAKYKKWSSEMGAKGKLVGGDKLTDEGGRHLKLSKGKALATDGPFVEAKDLIGGYFMIDAVDYAEAEKIAETCPHLAGNQWIEIRRIEEMG
jgi:hypothetical protein